MSKSPLSFNYSGLKVFSACLLSSLLVTSPFVQIAAASRRAEKAGNAKSQPARQTTHNREQPAAPENIYNGPVPKPAPEPFAVTGAQLKVTLDDGVGVGISKRPGDTITYTATIQNTNPTDDATNVNFINDLTGNANLTLVPGSIQTQPIARNDSYNALGNVQLDVPAASGLISNDRDPDVGNGTLSGLTINAIGADNSAPFSHTTANGGIVEASATDGSFKYNPPAGFEGTDSFTYTVTDATGKTDTATAQITIAEVVWFVNNTAGACTANCDGRLTNPLTSLTTLAANSGADADESFDVIFVHTGSSNYTGGIALEANQRLVGQGVSLDAALTAYGITVPPHSIARPAAGSNPTIVNGAGNAITLNNINDIRGLTAQAANNAAISGTGVSGATTISNVSVTTSSTGGGVSLSNLAGIFTASNSSISSSAAGTGTAVLISGGSSAITFSNTPVSQSGGRVIDIQNRTGGTVGFDTGSTVTQTAGSTDAVVLRNNTGGSVINFLNNVNLTTSSGRGLQTDNSTGSFTLNMTAAGNTISATGGAAIDVEDIAADLDFVTLASTNSTAQGIRIFNLSNSPAGRSITVTTSTTVTNSAGTGVLVDSTAAAISLAALSSAPAANQIGVSITANTGTVSSTAGTISTTDAPAVNVNSSPLAMTLTSVSANNTGDADSCVNLASMTGTLTMNGGALTGGNAAAFLVSGATNGSSTYNGTITQNTGGQRAVDVQSKTGGTTTFGGLITASTTTANAIHVVSNTGATVTFSGGMTLTTTSGTGFNATGGGTVNATQNNTSIINTISSGTGGVALNVANTTIGASGLTFKSIAANGAANGIVLNTTGAIGGLTVLGDGASDPANTTRGRTTAKQGGGTVVLGSGGVIQNCTGAGMSLTSTTGVTLRNMTIQNNSGDGMTISSLSGLTLDNVLITGHPVKHGILGTALSALTMIHSDVGNNATTSGVVEGPDIWNIRLLNFSGTSSIQHSNIHHGHEMVFGIIDTSGTLNLSITNTNITDTGATAGGASALTISANGSSNITLNIQDSSVLRGRARGIQVGTETAASSSFSLTVNNCQFIDNGLAVEIAHGSSGTNTYSITNNNIQATAGSLQAININRLGSGSFSNFGLFSGVVSGNTIGTAAIANSGSDTGSGIEVESNGSGGITRTTISNNTIRQVALYGIYVAVVDTTVGGGPQPTVEARLDNNSIANMKASALDGINVTSGALNTDNGIMCLDFISNNVTAPRNGLRIRPSGLPQASPTVRLEGWDGVTAVNTYFINRPNTLAGSVAQIFTDDGNGSFQTSAGCNTPAVASNLINKPGLQADPAQIDRSQKTEMASVAIEASQPSWWKRLADLTLAAAKEISAAVSENHDGASRLTETQSANATLKHTSPNLGGMKSEVRSHHAKTGTAKDKNQEPKIRKQEPVKKPGAKNPRELPGPLAGSFTGNIGTLPANDSVTITFQVTIAATLSPASANSVSNQATVTADGGINKVSDDPQTTPPAAGDGNDATVTPIDKFEPVIDIQTNDNNIDQGDPVTFTATLTHGTALVDPLPTGTVNFVDQTDANPANWETLCSNVALTVGVGNSTAQCTTSNVDAGTRTIAAVYSGDGRYDPATDTVAQIVTIPLTISVNDAKQVEPSAGTRDMVFTVALSSPATGAASVNFQTADNTATAGTCGNPGADYTSTSGTVSFTAGQQVKTINVPVCSDPAAEGDETFTVTLNTPTGATILDGTATGTITVNTPGTLIISEFRTRGPAGANDDFVELYNNTNSPLVVPAGGYGVFKMGADCNQTPVLVGTVAPGTIPAHGHYMLTGSTYSLANYGGTNAALGNASLTADIEDDRNIAVFSTTDITAISSTNRLDAVGSGTNIGAVCDLLREGATVAPVGVLNIEYSYFRKECDYVSGIGCATPGTPKDTNDNATDFKFADTVGTFIAGVTQALGAPGPQNLASPILRNSVVGNVLDATKAQSAPPNRVRDLMAGPPATSTNGTLSIRRRFQNTTGATVTKLRFRIVEMTTFPSPGGGIADLRGLTSSAVVISGITDAATCASTGTPTTVPCQVTAQATTLEQPPTQNSGGGYNATVSMNIPGGLPNGQSIDVNFTLGVQTAGTFRFLIIVEALP